MKAKQRSILSLVASAVLCLAAYALSNWDGYVSTIARNMTASGDWRRLVNLAEVFAYGGTVAMILLCLWWSDSRRRYQLAWAGMLISIAGVSSNLLKACVARVRPNAMSYLHIGQDENGWMSVDFGSYWDSALRSFPSGHSATAIAFALALANIYPKGRFFFFGFAVVACSQRLVSGAHYLSDIAVGASVGLLIGSLMLCLHSRFLHADLTSSGCDFDD